jgi:hypothetical protein
MLVRPDGLLITQPAHAWISGQLARAWGNDAFPAPEPREVVCLAAEQHDVGWADADRAPLPDPDGRPRSFMAYPRPAHVAIWREAAPRMLAQSRYAALLVSLHGTSLYASVDTSGQPAEVAEAIADYLRTEAELQAVLSAGLDAEEVERNRKLIALWDRMSLRLCHEQAGVVDGITVSAPGDDRVATMAPWPFSAEVVEVGCDARRLERGATDQAELAALLARAPWVPLRWVIRPG